MHEGPRLPFQLCVIDAGAVAANWRLSMQSIVNLAPSKVYHSEHPAYLFAACSLWCSGFVSDSWSLFIICSNPPYFMLFL